MDIEELTELKKGAIAHRGDFISMVNYLRKVVFLNSGRWEKESAELYLWIKNVIQAAYEDPTIQLFERNLKVIIKVTPLISLVAALIGLVHARLAADLEHSRVSNWVVIKRGKYILAWIELKCISKHEMYMNCVP
ncbi:LOW QUALITY PROTEIN: hypothetical protein IFM46972_11369 [Aspergillus udagawae]|uniref:Uncharacterized protein n=1 Tax=Aspergillus udagawae TaxID=91492 RepID=A0A8H3SGB8_9EURO|nr:LOW QUALITY PROTEIN: hypothetical protein IFM46972_11369 [Aspergillus udagawae]